MVVVFDCDKHDENVVVGAAVVSPKILFAAILRSTGAIIDDDDDDVIVVELLLLLLLIDMIPERFPEIAAADFNNDNDDIAELLRCLFELIIDENDVGIVDDVSVVVTVSSIIVVDC
mgnify:CR=1 FL=1